MAGGETEIAYEIVDVVQNTVTDPALEANVYRFVYSRDLRAQYKPTVTRDITRSLKTIR
jgi:hypothetical protein